MDKELEKGSFIRRVCAYLIDSILITILVSLLSTPFVDVDKTNTIEKESNEIIEKYQTGEITGDEYIQRYSSIYYELSRNTGIMTLR